MRAEIFAGLMVCAVGLACGSGDKKGSDSESLCAAACDTLNSCQAQLHTDACVAKTYVADCKAAIDGGDAAKKTEVTCLSAAACTDAPKCLGNNDPCAAVTCDTGKTCNPDTAACDKPNCQWLVQGQSCTDDKVCIGPKGSNGKVTSGFCSPATPRSYVFSFGAVTLPATNDQGAPWRTNGMNPDLKVGMEINDVAAGSSDVHPGALSVDFTGDEAAQFTVRVDVGDKVSLIVYDVTADGDKSLISCVADTDLKLASWVQGGGVNCVNQQNVTMFKVQVHPQ